MKIHLIWYVCITDTWLMVNKNLKFKVLSIIRMERPDQVGGGVATLIRREIEYNQISSDFIQWRQVGMSGYQI